MAYYDQGLNRIVYWPSEPYSGFSGWRRVDCGCCAGIKWGGEYPQECNCNGGWIALHVKSGRFAAYPGGPFVGRQTDREMNEATTRP